MTMFKPEGCLIHTSENSEYLKNLNGLKEAYRKEIILEAKAIICTGNHDLIVDLGFCKGLIPRTEGALGIADGSAKDIALISKVNKAVAFIVTDFDTDKNGNITPILSRRKAQEKCVTEYISKLQSGDIINAVVTHLEPFGAFVDIGCGIPSLLPIDTISVSRISHPSDRFSVGDFIKVIVKDHESDSRITLSHKELLGTWEENSSLYSVGETVSGIVRSVENYGIFVELTPNLAGLAEPKPDVYEGQQASVYIKNIIPDKMKVKLILVDSFDNTEPPENIHYFYNDTHIDHWQYSPQFCEKNICSDF